MRYTPSVEENATRLPAVITMWAISRVVVVFPFVPLTWITGTSRFRHRRLRSGLRGGHVLGELRR